MNNNKISNPKKEVPKGIALNEKDYITSLLTCLKDLVKNYTIAMTEASNEALYNNHKNAFLNLISFQREVYEVMFKNGWYMLEKEETQKINQKLETLNQEYQDLES